MHATRKAFTLIELLVVIAIIAILAVVVVLTLNPAELLRQSRDSNRVSDMNTLSSAINLYSTDQSGASSFNLGSSSVVYVSIPDPAATTTAGTNCSSLGLLTLPSGWTYHCAASSTYKNVNGTGWIPVNLTNISASAPISNLPVDPVNTSSSRDYYTYTTNGTQFELTAPMESQKYGPGGNNDVISPDGSTLATVLAKGSNLSLEPLDYGDPRLVGYWPLNEGSGSTAYDESGNNATGSWSGAQVGTSGYYSAGKVQPYAGTFNGSSTSPTVLSATVAGLTGSTQFTLIQWIYVNAYPSSLFVSGAFFNSGAGIYPYWSGQFRFAGSAFAPPSSGFFGTSPNIWVGAWNMFTLSADNATVYAYINGVLQSTTTRATPGTTSTDNKFQIGNISANRDLIGSENDIRIYNRALTSAQVAAMYNGEK